MPIRVSEPAVEGRSCVIVQRRYHVTAAVTNKASIREPYYYCYYHHYCCCNYDCASITDASDQTPLTANSKFVRYESLHESPYFDALNAFGSIRISSTRISIDKYMRYTTHEYIGDKLNFNCTVHVSSRSKATISGWSSCFSTKTQHTRVRVCSRCYWLYNLYVMLFEISARHSWHVHYVSC